MSGAARALSALLLSDDGRLARKAYWLYLVAICGLATLLLWLPAFRQSPLAIGLFHLAILYPSYCVFAKRLQDFGQSGKWAIVIALIAAGDAILGLPVARQALDALPVVARLWWWLGLGAGLALIAIGLVPGDNGANAHGLQP